MINKRVIPFLLLLFFSISNAQAQIDLIAIGQVSGEYQDMAIKTTSLLENGVAGNMLGGVGSGLAYAGRNTFIALPDRGPNATPYNSLVDDTTSFIPRFQTFSLSLAKNPNYDPSTVGSLPHILSPFLTGINRPINIRTHPSAYFPVYKVSGNLKKLFTSSIFCWIDSIAERMSFSISS